MLAIVSNWILAMRPRTLGASVAPVAIGSAMASSDDGFHLGSAGAALSGAIGVQVACNFANDYFDARSGVDRRERLGPQRAVSSGLISPRAMLVATAAVIVAVVVPSTIYLAARAGWPFIALGALAAVLAIAYTGGRWSLARLGLGDAFALVFFGPVAVCATYAAQTGRWELAPALAGLAPGFLACAIIGVNNLRDIPTDSAGGRRTMAVRWGERFGRIEFVACVLASGATIILMAVWFQKLPALAALFAIVTLVPTMRAVLGGQRGRSLNDSLAQTARALFLMGILFSLGWL